MKQTGIVILVAALALAAIPVSGARAEPTGRPDAPLSAAPAAGPVIHIEDLARFYKVFDAAHGHPSAEALQRNYLDPGSEGLHRLAKLRNVTGARIADEIAKHPEYYANARRCMAALPRVRERLTRAFHKLAALYPDAKFPPVTIAVSRGKPVGVADETGVMIGLEALCAVTWMNPDVEDRFVHVIAHEYTHVQQALLAPALYDKPKPTVLEVALVEGAAEFTAELTSGEAGEVSSSAFKAQISGREKEIESAFVRDEGKTDLSRWFYNGSMTKPGDLGYWVGYRIVKSWYQHAPDKRCAFRDILQMTDAKTFLAKSAWYPGIRLK
jgi:uncharacterized protein YjaZ